MATSPSPLKGVALVQPGRGIKVNYLYYWSDAFRNPEVERTKVPIRYDPFDISVAYAYVEGRWVKCISQYYSTFVGRSEKELLLASHEIRQQGKLTRTSTAISAKRLADFLANVQEHEALLLQRLRDAEGKQVLNALTEKPANVHAPETVRPDLPSVPSDETPLEQVTAPITAVELARLPVFEEYR